MTREEAIEKAPYSRKSYWWMIFTSLALIGVYVWLALFFATRLDNLARTIIYLCVGFSWLLILQAIERLFWPVRAALRSNRFTSAEDVLSVGKFLAYFIYGATVLVTILGLARWHGLKPNEGGLMIFLQMASLQFFRDLSGKKLVDKNELEHSPPLKDLKPLQSEEWGTRGTTHTIL